MNLLDDAPSSLSKRTFQKLGTCKKARKRRILRKTSVKRKKKLAARKT